MVPLESPPPSAPPRIETPPPAVDLRRPRVLIVDDDEGPRLTWKYGLQDEYETEAAGSVAEALALVKQHDYAVILLDIRMPGEDGLAGLKAIRVIDPMVSVIMVTSYTELAPAQQAMELGASGYMTKPAKVAELRSKVWQEAEKCRNRRAKERLHQSMQEVVTKLQRQIDDRGDDGLPPASAAMAFVHDLSQPLLATIGHATILTEDLQTVDAANFYQRRSSLLETGRNLHNAAQLCVSLTQNWRAVTKDRAESQRVNLSVVLSELHSGIFFSTPKVRIKTGPDLTVRANPVDLARIFQNLIHNALEAGSTEVRVSGYCESGMVRMTVTDNGPGMAAEMAKVALRKHVTSTKPGGTGIGLTIVRYLVQLQHGEISLSSEPGRGTTFYLTFPAATPPPV
ncbi:MAG TPA: hybrid sensor histidine kinase/response regulator [Opitutaceae bacterium]|jgi:signal transduction histidine kinase